MKTSSFTSPSTAATAFAATFPPLTRGRRNSHVATSVTTEQSWYTCMEDAANIWQSHEHSSSITRLHDAVQHAELLNVPWALLWNFTQLGICYALYDELELATNVFQRAVGIAITRGQPVVAGICVTLESLCRAYANQSCLPNTVRIQARDLYHGLVHYTHINKLPYGDVCWTIEAESPRVEKRATRASQSSETKLHVNVLGRFKLRTDNGPIINVPTGRGGALLKYLLVNHSQPIHFDVLLEQFWPDTNPTVSRNRLHQAIHSLRSGLASAMCSKELQIVYSECRYGFDPSLPILVDCESFEQLIATGKQAEQKQDVAQAVTAYQNAILLYQGDFLAEDRYVEWIQDSRTRFWNMYLELFDRLSVLSLSVSEHLAALDYCRRLLALDKCREDIHQRMIHCYVALGQRTQALRQYELCEQALRQELDIDPLPESTDLYQQVRDDFESLSAADGWCRQRVA